VRLLTIASAVGPECDPGGQEFVHPGLEEIDQLCSKRFDVVDLYGHFTH
jgi:hypothetical protein